VIRLPGEQGFSGFLGRCGKDNTVTSPLGRIELVMGVHRHGLTVVRPTVTHADCRDVFSLHCEGIC
jgi:hypothetical protein